MQATGGRGTEPGDPLVARNLRTGAALWSSGAQGQATIALDDGGAAAVNAGGALTLLDGTGATTGIDALNIAPVPYVYGRFHVRGSNNRLAAAVPWKPIDDATSYVGEQGAGSLTAASRQYGIWGKSHHVPIDSSPYKHVALRLIPRNQDKWLSLSNPWHSFFIRRPQILGDSFFVTSGAGPGGVGSTGYLTAGFNRGNDVTKPSVDTPEQVQVSPTSEDEAIGRLMAFTNSFRNNVLDYQLFPSEENNGFNSNSFLRGLLQVSQFPPLSFPVKPDGSTDFPGWFKPAPIIVFYPQR